MSFNRVGARIQQDDFQADDFQRDGGFKRAVEESATLSPDAYQSLASQMLYIVAGNCPEINANDVVKDGAAADEV